MQPLERMAADFAGTGLTIGPHPMSFHRSALALKGVLRAVDLPRQRPGRRVRVAGCVITRQRPGTAKGFVFLTLEDETGISNIIVRPKVYDEQRLAIIESSFVIVDGLLQLQDGVTAIQAERVLPLDGVPHRRGVARLSVGVRRYAGCTAVDHAPAAPTPSSDRLPLLDATRGVALLGIFTLNLAPLSGFVFMKPEEMSALPTAAVDLPAALVILWLGYGKFYSLFSLLFGIGFALQIDSAARDSDQRLRRFRRRLLVLLAIGFVHLTFIWEGDILALYALVGFALIPLRRLSQRALIVDGGRAAGAAGGGAGADCRKPRRARPGCAAARDRRTLADRDGVCRRRHAVPRAQVRELHRGHALSTERHLVPLRRPAHDGAPVQGAGDVRARPMGGPKRHVARHRAVGAAAAARAPGVPGCWSAGRARAGADGGQRQSARLAVARSWQRRRTRSASRRSPWPTPRTSRCSGAGPSGATGSPGRLLPAEWP